MTRARRDYATAASFWTEAEAQEHAAATRTRLAAKGLVSMKVRVKWTAFSGWAVQIGTLRDTTPQALRPYRR